MFRIEPAPSAPRLVGPFRTRARRKSSFPLRRRVSLIIQALGVLQCLRNAVRPLSLSSLINNEVLTDLDLNIGQTMRFSMVGDSVMSQLHKVWFVLGDQQLLIATQHL